MQVLAQLTLYTLVRSLLDATWNELKEAEQSNKVIHILDLDL